MTQPLVTCLCLTMEGRGEFLKRAVRCFRRQKYENCHLLIVADLWSDTDFLFPAGSSISDGISERVTAVAIGEKLTIGGKRNLGCSLAQNSDLIAHWDDDDFSSPGRIERQVEELQSSGRAVTGFNAMKFQSLDGWYQYRFRDPGFVFGTSLMYRRDWWEKHPFGEINVGEDSAFCAAAYERNQLAEVRDLNLMYATIHAGNTSKRNVRDFPWLDLPGFQWDKA